MEGVRQAEKARRIKYLPGRKEGLEFECERVVGANRWRALELVLVLSRGTAETESERLIPFFLSADLRCGFSETGFGLVVDARLRRVWPASRVSVFCGIKGESLEGGD